MLGLIVWVSHHSCIFESSQIHGKLQLATDQQHIANDLTRGVVPLRSFINSLRVGHLGNPLFSRKAHDPLFLTGASLKNSRVASVSVRRVYSLKSVSRLSRFSSLIQMLRNRTSCPSD